MPLLHQLAVLLGTATVAIAPGDYVDSWTARWEGPIGWPFECPLKTRLIWMNMLLATTGGARQMPQGPLLGQGDLGMTLLTDEGAWPSGSASGTPPPLP